MLTSFICRGLVIRLHWARYDKGAASIRRQYTGIQAWPICNKWHSFTHAVDGRLRHSHPLLLNSPFIHNAMLRTLLTPITESRLATCHSGQPDQKCQVFHSFTCAIALITETHKKTVYVYRAVNVPNSRTQTTLRDILNVLAEIWPGYLDQYRRGCNM
jgi:hypothetical protein